MNSIKEAFEKHEVVILQSYLNDDICCNSSNISILELMPSHIQTASIHRKTSWLTGRLMLVYALQDILELDFKEVVQLIKEKLDYLEHGKPYLKDLNIFFNISHSKDFIVVAIADTNCAIDIEFIKNRKNYVALKDKILDADERKFVEVADSYFKNKDFNLNKLFINDYQINNEKNILNDELLRFFTIWTIKETAVKLTGDGVPFINDFRVCCDSEKIFTNNAINADLQSFLLSADIEDGSLKSINVQSKYLRKQDIDSLNLCRDEIYFYSLSVAKSRDLRDCLDKDSCLKNIKIPLKINSFLFDYFNFKFKAQSLGEVYLNLSIEAINQ